MINKRSPIPYYEQLAAILRQEINSKQVDGKVFQLPSENELSSRYSISRATVRHALQELENESLIYREKGRGSFAAVRRVDHELTQLVSTTDAMRKRGWSVTTRVVDLKRMPASPPVFEQLELDPGAGVFELTRLRLAGDEPISLQMAYLPEELMPGLEKFDLSGSLTRVIEEHYGLLLWSGRETLWARGASQKEAQLLEIKKDAAVIYTERVTYLSDGKPVEYLRAVWRGDRYNFKVNLTRASV